MDAPTMPTATPCLRSNPQHKAEQVRAILSGYSRVLVAFSGGVDSTLLAALAQQTLGRANVLAVTADSASLSRDDLAYACEVARVLDLQHVVIATDEVGKAAYRVNTATRCYVCKQELFEKLAAFAHQRGISVILYGAIGDDVSSQRPGQRAARERGIGAPLQEVGLSKAHIRQLAREIGLPNWNRPQNACLASRIPHGLAVSEEKLRQVEEAEGVLRAAGFRQVRVRHLGLHARIEVGREEVVRFDDPTLRQQLSAQLGALGFTSVGVARDGYREGGANLSAQDEIPLVGNK